MAKRPKILDVLGRIDDPVADEAFVAGVLFVDAGLQTAIVDLLLTRRRPVGLEALPQFYDKLEESSRRRIVGQTARLFSALREMGLSIVDRVLLRWIARRSALDQPIVLLFSPALLDQQASACVERLSPAPLRRYARGRLNAVMSQVFVEQQSDRSLL